MPGRTIKTPWTRHSAQRVGRVVLALSLAAPSVALAQFPGLTLPPSGDNQKASVTQHIGPVKITVDYSSPDVRAPNGEDRRGKVWGQLVPYGLVNLGFGTCKECPWRAGANENTVITVSHDVTVQGQPLPAGRYGLHMIVDPNEWTVIFSKNSTSWGSFFYDPAEDQLRVKAKPEKAAYQEWLSYEFTDRQPDRTTLVLSWEELALPFTFAVPDITGVYVTALQRELRDQAGFSDQGWANAAAYTLQVNKHLDLGLTWAEKAISDPFAGRETFGNLSLLARLQAANGKADDAKKTMDRALAHPTASALDLHGYGRQLVAQGKAKEALAVFQMNAKKNPDNWVVLVGLARGNSAVGNYAEALKYAKEALTKAPDEQNKASLAAAIEKLSKGQDMNQ